MIFSNHAHMFPKQLREDGDVPHLLALLDACEIDKSVCFAPFDKRFHESAQFCDVNVNEWLAKEIQGNDRLVGFGTIDVSEGARPISDQVQQIYELGFKGIKIHPAFQEIKVNGTKAYQIYQKAEELGLFVSFHTGLHWHRISDYQMLLFDDITWDFPNLNFSLEHVGGYSMFRLALLVMCNNKRNPHVFAGLTSVEPENGHLGPWSLTDEELETLIYQTGEDRTMFGLDFPYKGIDYVKSAMARIRRLQISDEAKANILGGTLERMLFKEDAQ